MKAIPLIGWLHRVRMLWKIVFGLVPARAASRSGATFAFRTLAVLWLLSLIWFPAIGQGAAWKRHIIDGSSSGADGVRLADVNRDGRPDITTGWEQGGVVRLYLHPGHSKAKEPWPAVTVGKTGDVEDAVFADLDGDGSTDVISCSEGGTQALYVHWGPSESSRLIEPAAWTTDKMPAPIQQRWMFALPLQVDRRHGLDIVAGAKAGGKNAPQSELGWFEAPANPRRLADWRWHKLREIGWLMSLIAEDMDGDADADVVFTDRRDGPRTGCFWLENPGPGKNQTEPWREHSIGAAGREVMFATVADLDNDGRRDVLAAVLQREIHWFRRLSADGRQWQTIVINIPPNTGRIKAVGVGDIDLDGRADVVYSCEQASGGRQGLGWLSVKGDPVSGQWTHHELSGADGVKHDLVPLVDLDGDGDLDVLTTEEVKNLGVIWYENPAK